MSRLIKIALWSDATRASVIFVHGLGGHAYDTWRRAPDNNTFWPLWLAKDVEGISIYTLAYEAPPTNWLGTSMPLQDRAVNVLEILLSEPGLKSGPITFICHSLGGLIVKQIVLDLQQQKERRPEAADLLQRVTQVVFAATPHTGARQAALLDRLRFFAWPSSIARTLVANDPTLRHINRDYRGLAEERRKVLQHRVFYETQGTPAGVIVDEASSDPGLPGDPPVPVDANHISIVKPLDRSSVLYARARDFIAKSNPVPETQEGGLEIYPLPTIQPEQPLNVLPKLIRIAAIGLVVLIGYKGVQTLIAPPPPIEQIQKPLVDQLARKDEQLARKDEQIADLAKLLLAKNPSAGPGAQQVVGGALQSIAQGAAEGDKRLQQAFDFLKDNKVAEATQLLTAVVEDKSAHAEQAAAQAEQAAAQAEKDRKEVATAYRNLGAIAGLRDPKAALEAYEKAVALDPNDLDSLMGIGVIQIGYGDLHEAQTRLEHMLTLAKTGDQAYYKYWALLSLGDIKHQRGDLVGALKSYNDGLAFIDPLAKSNPNNARLQGDLSVSYGRIGDVQKEQGDLAGALKSYQDDLAINERLAKSDPGNDLWQRGLWVSRNKIGEVLVALGDLAGALVSHQAGLDIIEAFARRYPAANPALQRDLSVNQDLIGDVQMAQGALADALKSYQDSLATRDRRAKSDPGNAEWQRDLSVCYTRIGKVQMAQGDLAGALKSCQDSLAIRERLAKSDPRNAGWQGDLAESYGNIGDVQNAQGDLKSALKSYQDGLAIVERFAQSDPGNVGWQGGLAMFYDKIGGVQVAQGDLKAALKSYSNSLAIRERLAQSDPGKLEWQRNLSVGYGSIGGVQVAQGDLKAALKSYSNSLTIAERLAQSDPGNAGWQRDLSKTYANLADAYRKSNETAKAREALAAGRAIIGVLVEQHPDQVQWKQDLTWFDARIAEQGQSSPKKKPVR